VYVNPIPGLESQWTGKCPSWAICYAIGTYLSIKYYDGNSVKQVPYMIFEGAVLGGKQTLVFGRRVPHSVLPLKAAVSS
jgi:hypothetical protein